MFFEASYHQGFSIRLFGNDQVAFRAVLTGLVEIENLFRLDVDDQWVLSDLGLLVAPGAFRECAIVVGIQEEIVAC